MERLIGRIQNGRQTPENNLIENAIRLAAVVRKDRGSK
jgi:hypothetical protein